MINHIMPTLILSCMTLLAFYFPYAQQILSSNPNQHSILFYSKISNIHICLVGITIFLTLSVFSVRIADDIPTQGTPIPLIFIYFTVDCFLDFSVLLYFIIKDSLDRSQTLPTCIQKIGLLLTSHKVTHAKGEECCEKCEECIQLKYQALSGFDRLVFWSFVLLYCIFYSILWALIFY